MSIKDVFAERFTLVRNTYHNTYKEISNVLGINANTITEWTKSKRNFPDPVKLNLIANIYGLKIDWLFGRTNQLYDHDILCGIEHKFTVNFLMPIFMLPNEYLDDQLRQRHYSNGIRANIIAITFTTQYAAFSKVLGPNFYKNPDYDALLENNKSAIQIALSDMLVARDNLVYRLLFFQKREAPYDVEYAFKQLLLQKSNNHQE